MKTTRTQGVLLSWRHIPAFRAKKTITGQGVSSFWRDIPASGTMRRHHSRTSGERVGGYRCLAGSNPPLSATDERNRSRVLVSGAVACSYYPASGFMSWVHLVDMDYMEAALSSSSQERGIDLVGPMPSSRGWQDRDETAFDHRHCQIDWDFRVAWCPGGNRVGLVRIGRRGGAHRIRQSRSDHLTQQDRATVLSPRW